MLPNEAAFELIKTGNVFAVLSFLTSGQLDLKARDPRGETLLHVAAAEGVLGVVEALVAAGAPLDAPDKRGFQPLDAAIREHHDDVTEFLRKAGAPAKASEMDVFEAVGTDHESLVKFVLSLDPEAVNAQNEHGLTPLHISSRYNLNGVFFGCRSSRSIPARCST